VGWNDLTMDTAVISGNTTLFEKGDRLNYSPEYTAGAFADYRFPLGGTAFEGELSVSASYSSEQTNHGDGYVTTGDELLIVRAGFSIDSPNRWSATLFVDNLTNCDGAGPAEYPVPDWYPRVRPRTMGLQFEYRYQ
jgi:hypothetical protein